MVKYFDEECQEDKIKNKADRKKVKRVFCIGNGESQTRF